MVNESLMLVNATSSLNWGKVLSELARSKADPGGGIYSTICCENDGRGTTSAGKIKNTVAKRGPGVASIYGPGQRPLLLAWP
jgi:hypothetical protein